MMASIIPFRRQPDNVPEYGTPETGHQLVARADDVDQLDQLGQVGQVDDLVAVDNAGQLVDVVEDDPGAAPVITAVVTGSTAERPGDLRPIVPGWLRSAQGRRAVARWWLRIQWHRLRFHGFRLPAYIGRVLFRAPRGAIRGAGWALRWALDTRADGLEQLLATGTKQDAEEFRKLREDRAARVRSRLAVVGALAVVAVVALVLAWQATGTPVRAGAALALALVLARLGSDPGRPLVAAPMTVGGGFRELTWPILYRALRVAGLGGQAAKLDKAGAQLDDDTRPTLATDIARSENGRGSVALIDLPFGKTAGDLAEKLQPFASGLDVEEAQVFPEPVQGSTRRVRVYVADEDPMTLPAHRSPLARMPRVSVWDPQVLARTPVGREVRAPILFSSYLVGAIPRMGKSFAAKLLVTPAVLDPHCDITNIDCKGGRDWQPVADVAVDFRAGDETEDLAHAVAILERRRSEARARLAEFRKLTDAQMPEDKLTRELAEAGMHPHVIIVDEIQNLLRCNVKEIQKAALDVLTWLAKTAPAAGYSLVMITQRPAADVIPADLRDVTAVRIALKTKTAQGSDAILGSYVSAGGYRTDRFRDDHKGAAVIGGIPTGLGGDLQVVRTDLLMPAEFKKACAVGRQRRIDAGTLRGQAAGEAAPVEVTVTIVEDVAAVWPGDDAKVQAHVLVGRLREVFGDRYAELDEAGLTRALKPRGVRSIQVNRDGANRQGYQLADVDKARRAIEAE